MPTSDNQFFSKEFKTKEGKKVLVSLSAHSNWPPRGMTGGATYSIDIKITGPIGERKRRLKYRDGNNASMDNADNNIADVTSVKLIDGVYILQTDVGERAF